MLKIVITVLRCQTAWLHHFTQALVIFTFQSSCYNSEITSCFEKENEETNFSHKGWSRQSLSYASCALLLYRQRVSVSFHITSLWFPWPWHIAPVMNSITSFCLHLIYSYFLKPSFKIHIQVGRFLTFHFECPCLISYNSHI